MDVRPLLTTEDGRADKPKVSKIYLWTTILVLVVLVVASIHIVMMGGCRPSQRLGSHVSEYSGYVPKSKEVNDFQKQVRDDSPWNETALQALRTAFHFQPPNKWMNDPNAPLYYEGWYHLFYQYNPVEAYWGLISWGHAISKDLIHWYYIKELAMVPDKWYDVNGVWTGSATILPETSEPIILYTSSTSNSVQVQCLAYPTTGDLLLRTLQKSNTNPILSPPSFINYTDFRDPTTAWYGRDGQWTMAIGSRLEPSHMGFALLYRSTNFQNWTLLPTFLHTGKNTGMWECVDFYPIDASGGVKGLDTSTPPSSSTKFVIKASMDDSKLDFYCIGSYDDEKFKFVPDYSWLDLTLGFRYDYGRYYASKTFFDPIQSRRILFGWINESDTQHDDIVKDWSGIMGIARQVWFDNKTSVNLIQWPVEELVSLRESNITIDNITLESDSTMKIDGGQGAQWDITLSFKNPIKDLYKEGDKYYSPIIIKESLDGFDYDNNNNNTFGPFGLYVLSSDDLQERTGVYFYIHATQLVEHDRTISVWKVVVCNDLTSSSLASMLDKNIQGGNVIVTEDEEELTLRVLVDHSIVETFAQGGRTVASSRVYPTMALNGTANIFLFNNATKSISLKHFEAWKLSSIDLDYYDE